MKLKNNEIKNNNLKKNNGHWKGGNLCNLPEKNIKFDRGKSNIKSVERISIGEEALQNGLINLLQPMMC